MRVHVVMQEQIVGFAERTPIREEEVARLEVTAKLEVVCEWGVPVDECAVVIGGIVEMVV